MEIQNRKAQQQELIGKAFVLNQLQLVDLYASILKLGLVPMLVIPATWEAKTGRWRSRASPQDQRAGAEVAK
jgi:hypothetical protein